MAGSLVHTVAQASEGGLEAEMRDFDDRNTQRYCLLGSDNVYVRDVPENNYVQ